MKPQLATLAPIVTRWQRTLRLRDWKIDARWVNPAELAAFFAEDEDEEHPERMAKQACAATDASHCEQEDTTSLENRKARILMKRGAFESAAEAEQAIVHELLHLLLWPIAPDDADALRRILLEQIISTLEIALTTREK